MPTEKQQSEHTARYNTSVPDTPPTRLSDNDVLRTVKQHAHDTLDNHSELNPPAISDIDWRLSTRLKTAHGHANGEVVVLSRHSLERNGWNRFFRTVRHELVHAHQYHNDLLPDDADAHDHDSFEKWMQPLDIKKRGGTVTEPAYTVSCDNCASVNDSYHNLTSYVKNAVQGNIKCGRCRDASYTVYDEDGNELDADDVLPSVEQLEPEETSVFSFNAAAVPDIDTGDYTWYPVSVSLTSFAGIGDTTLINLAQDDTTDITDITDLLGDSNEELAPVVKETVSSRWHDELRNEVVSRWDEVKDYRNHHDQSVLENRLSEDNWASPQD